MKRIISGIEEFMMAVHWYPCDNSRRSDPCVEIPSVGGVNDQGAGFGFDR